MLFLFGGCFLAFCGFAVVFSLFGAVVLGKSMGHTSLFWRGVGPICRQTPVFHDLNLVPCLSMGCFFLFRCFFLRACVCVCVVFFALCCVVLC